MIVFISQVTVSENLPNKNKKWCSTEKDKKSHTLPTCHKVILNSKAFAFFNDLHIWRKPIQWYVNFDGIPDVTKCNL